MRRGLNGSHPAVKLVFVACLIIAAAPSLAEQACDTSQYGLSAPTERFDDNGDGTVTDKESGLIWMRCSAGQEWSEGSCVGDAAIYDWASAQTVADNVNREGVFFFNDWRVPKLGELATIVERQCNDPRINLAVFPNTPADAFWTATSRPGSDEPYAYVLDFGPAGVVREPRERSHLVRLVRTGP